MLHEIYMKKALELALGGWGTTNPNPLVGAVIVKDGWIIGEGFHEKAGAEHAEIMAIKNCSQDLKGASLYVNLEPCAHFGRTPPCVNSIIESGLSEVIIGMKDPNPLVAGKGISALEQAGIKVVQGVLEEESKKLNEIFVKYITEKRPFVIMKMAMSLDGKICTHTGESKWISCEESRKYVHNLRKRAAAVMVGTNTVMKDNPRLTARLDGAKNPFRIILDRKGRIPLESNVFSNDRKTIMVVSEGADPERIKALEEKASKVITLRENDSGFDLDELMEKLYSLKIDSILLEGGGNLNFSALKSGIVDKVIIFIAPVLLGGKDSLTPVEGQGYDSIAEALRLKNISTRLIGNDIMIEGYTKLTYNTEKEEGCVYRNCSGNRCCKSC